MTIGRALLSRRANQPLLLGFTVRVLDHDGEQLKGVALRQRGAPSLLADQIELWPRPALIGTRLDRPAAHRAFDGRGAKGHLATGSGRILVRIGRTSVANHGDGIPAVGGKAERPQQPGSCDYAIDFSV